MNQDEYLAWKDLFCVWCESEIAGQDCNCCQNCGDTGTPCLCEAAAGVSSGAWPLELPPAPLDEPSSPLAIRILSWIDHCPPDEDEDPDPERWMR